MNIAMFTKCDNNHKSLVLLLNTGKIERERKDERDWRKRDNVTEVTSFHFRRILHYKNLINDQSLLN